ncbi:putative histone-binding protein RBBP4 [Rosa chinensis]|uniref:Putative histone-binding protein RBBP4 n=1 Tax=Rosa chinensis TaxID=74649 RepID=A0A2P6QDK1_ROSCH|nr:putative histone-binding protein RBBP4 [Rosa chinensis]
MPSRSDFSSFFFLSFFFLSFWWPSLTVEWLPNQEEQRGKDYSVQKMILGTHTSEKEPN